MRTARCRWCWRRRRADAAQVARWAAGERVGVGACAMTIDDRGGRREGGRRGDDGGGGAGGGVGGGRARRCWSRRTRRAGRCWAGVRICGPAGDLYDVAMARQSGGLASVAQRLGDMAVVPAWGRPFRLTQALVAAAGAVGGAVRRGRRHGDRRRRPGVTGRPDAGGAGGGGRGGAGGGVGAGPGGGDDGVGDSRRPPRRRRMPAWRWSGCGW